MSLRLALTALLLASSTPAFADGWSGPGYYVWAPSSTGWDSTKVLWSNRYDSYDKCLPAANDLNAELDPDRASKALFLFECHEVDQPIRLITTPELEAILREVGK